MWMFQRTAYPNMSAVETGTYGKLGCGSLIQPLGVCVFVYRGADKSLARPGRKQTNVSVRMA